MISMARIGFGLSRQELPLTVKSVLDEADKAGIVSESTAKFKNNLPSVGWVYSFHRRHPELSTRVPEKFGFQRLAVTEESTKDWFKGLEEFLKEEHGLDAADFLSETNKDRIFNLDESGFPLQGTSGKLQVFTLKGTKNVHRLGSDNKQQITVLFCVSAAGTFSKPYVIFPGKKRPNFNLAEVSEDSYDLGYTEQGWISSDTFFEWLANLFYPSIKDKVEFPVLILMDGHSSHINISVSDFCRDHGIIMYLLPPHGSHLLQPLDVGVFGPLKKLWDKSVRKYYLTYKMPLTKAQFFPVFDEAWKESIRSPCNAISGFRATGLVPFNVENIDFSKLLTSKHAKAFNNKEKRAETLSSGERVGFTRALVFLESQLDEPKLEQFKLRYEEGYNVHVNDDSGTLWRMYKFLNDCLKNKDEQEEQCSEPPLDNDDNGDSNDTIIEEVPLQQLQQNDPEPGPSNSAAPGALSAMEPGTSSATGPVTSNTSEPGSSKSSAPGTSKSSGPGTSTSELGTLNPLEPVTSNSTVIRLAVYRNTHGHNNLGENYPERQDETGQFQPNTMSTPSKELANNGNETLEANESIKSYDNFDQSPFKSFLKISDSVVIAKKNQPKNKKKRTTPFSLSGSLYNKSLKLEQEKKAKEKADKERRKREREEKKLQKQNQAKAKKRIQDHFSSSEVSETESEPEVEYIDDSDASALENEIHSNDAACAACLGRERWNENTAWIGCNRCDAWVHRHCVSKEVEEMTREELRSYNFVCSACMKRQSRLQK